MKLGKQQRAALRAKFGGRCAYCGEPLGERWHADHIEAVERKLEFVRDGFRTRLSTTGEVHRPERDCIDNLNPACAPCNIDKHAMSLEGWRQKLQNAPGVLTRNQPTYRHAVRYGLVQETGATVTFYFERIAPAALDAGNTGTDGVEARPPTAQEDRWLHGAVKASSTLVAPGKTQQQERARQLAEDWHEGVPKDKQQEWANRAAGLLPHFADGVSELDGEAGAPRDADGGGKPA